MAAVDLLAGTVMDKSASLMNDTARSVYTYIVMVPYLQIALQELREIFELNSIPVTKASSALINIPTGQTSIEYNAVAPIPRLPDNFVEPNQLWERAEGIDPYIPMSRREFLPHGLEGNPTGYLVCFTWNGQKIEFLASTRDNDIKMDYVAELFSPIVDETSHIDVVNAATFLEFRTAALLAKYIERNMTSAQNLDTEAILAIDRATGIGVKTKQSIMTRRRPFRSSYKRRGWIA